VNLDYRFNFILKKKGNLIHKLKITIGCKN